MENVICFDRLTRANEQINRIDDMLEDIGIKNTFDWWHRPNQAFDGLTPMSMAVHIDQVEEFVSRVHNKYIRVSDLE